MTRKRPASPRKKAISRDQAPPPRGVQLRGRVWVETPRGEAALTPAGADLLEQIGVAGSLSEAARRLRYSYRHAWLLLDAMNRRWQQPLVITATGGKRGGGAQLTELGVIVLRSYRDVQVQLEHLLDTATPAFRLATRG